MGSQYISQECSGMSQRQRTVQVNEVALLCDSGQGSAYDYEDRGVCLSGDTAKAAITCTCEEIHVMESMRMAWDYYRRDDHEIERFFSRCCRSLAQSIS